MRKGKPQKIYWPEFAVSKFTLPRERLSAQCGAYALHTITKDNYYEIEELSRNGHWPTRLMLKYLRDRGCSVVPVTVGNVVGAHSVKGEKPKIRSENVLLLDQKCYREESTWSVVYGNKICHSGDVKDLSPLEFVNFPIEAAYLIFHPSWK